MPTKHSSPEKSDNFYANQGRKLQEMQHDLEQKIEKFESVADDPFTTKRIETLQANLKEVKSALGMHEMGLYGACIDCDETIPKARLEENPEAILCERCAE